MCAPVVAVVLRRLQQRPLRRLQPRLLSRLLRRLQQRLRRPALADDLLDHSSGPRWHAIVSHTKLASEIGTSSAQCISG